MSTTRLLSVSNYSNDKNPPSSAPPLLPHDGPSQIEMFFNSLQSQPLIAMKRKKKKTPMTALDQMRRVCCSPTMTWHLNEHTFQTHKSNKLQHDLPLEGIVLSYFAAHCYWDRYLGLGLNPLMVTLSPDSILDLTVVQSSWSRVTFSSDAQKVTCLITRAGHLKYISKQPLKESERQPFILPATCLFYPTQTFGKCLPPINVTVDNIIHRWTHRVVETYHGQPVAVTYLGDNLSPVTVETSTGSFFHKILALVYRFKITRVETAYTGQTLLDLLKGVTPAEGVCVCLTNCLTLPKAYPVDKNPNITLPSIGLSQYKHYMDKPIKPLTCKDVYSAAVRESPTVTESLALLDQQSSECFNTPPPLLELLVELVTSVNTGSVLNWVWLGHVWNGSLSGLYGLYLWAFYTCIKQNPTPRGLMIWNELIEACASCELNPAGYSAFYLYMQETFFDPQQQSLNVFLTNSLSFTRHPQDLDALLKTYLPDKQKWYNVVINEGVYWTIDLNKHFLEPCTIMQKIPLDVTRLLLKWKLPKYISFYSAKGGELLDSLAVFNLLGYGDKACALLMTNALLA
nr:ORF51 [Acipenserid herpesvirus 1]